MLVGAMTRGERMVEKWTVVKRMKNERELTMQADFHAFQFTAQKSLVRPVVSNQP